MGQLHSARSVDRTESGGPASASALWTACRNGDTDMVIDLLKNGASTDFVDESGETVLHCAIKHIETLSSDPSPIVSSLIEHGASVNARSPHGTPLYLACERGLTGVVKQLVQSNADAADVSDRKNPLFLACEMNYREIVRILVKSGANVNMTDGSRSKLIFAAGKANSGVVEGLLNHGAKSNSTDSYGTTALHVAVLRMRYREYSSDDVMSTITALLKHGGANLDALNGDGVTALYLACSCSNEIKYSVVQLLLQSGADPNIISVPDQPTQNSGRTRRFRPTYSRSVCRISLLSYAARHNDVTLMTLLLKFGAQLELKDTSGKTALHYALEPDKHKGSSYNTESLEFLLKSGAQVNVLDDAGISPLTLACSKDDLVLVKTLLSSGADPNLTTKAVYPLSLACQFRYHEVIKLLLEHGADMQAANSNSEPALCEALTAFDDGDNIVGPDSVIANLLLDHGADTNVMTSFGETPLYLSCLRNLTELVQKMLKCGAKVNIRRNQNSPLHAACRRNCMKIVRLLLNEGADPNVPEYIAGHGCSFALHIAVAVDNTELVNLLCKHGANACVADGYGNTALHGVAKNCSANSKFLLNTILKAGADVNICNIDGESPLYLAVGKCESWGYSRVRYRSTHYKHGLTAMSILLSHGADPNLTTTDKFPLCAACETQNVSHVNALLEAGANPNLTAAADTDRSISADIGGVVVHLTCELPLFIAVKKAKQKLAELLLNSGAKVNVLNSLRTSVLHFAVEHLTAGHDRSGRVAYHDTHNKPDSEFEETVNKSAQLVKLLLEHGADVNQLMPDGNSPLSLLLHYTKTTYAVRRGLSSRQSLWIQHKQIVDVVKVMISKGADLADTSNNLGHGFRPEEVKVVRSLYAWRCTDDVAVALLKAGAGFKFLAYCCMSKFTDIRILYPTKSVRVCQAAIMAGYVPSSDELVDVRQSIDPGYVEELLSWLNEDSKHAPSLMRQCRVAIRRRLSVASQHRTIIPAIDQLPLPCPLQQYLKFEGHLTETDLSTEDRNFAEEETN